MFITLQLDQFEINNIFTSEKTKNNIMNNSDFYRLYFSDEKVTTNGVFLKFTLYNVYFLYYFQYLSYKKILFNFYKIITLDQYQ